ncbi:hypothetical protein E2C01_045446 [Portunus trituberculatus]|uniref:Uncharacterized protein n=1 Tax=Portunus trituberculatus TaxID=210409 RepID=A0A5B7G219_PORTR|nr:hypothetical protein [Portunus trituberculatus]
MSTICFLAEPKMAPLIPAQSNSSRLQTELRQQLVPCVTGAVPGCGNLRRQLIVGRAEAAAAGQIFYN